MIFLQEEIENRTVTLIISSTKLTANLLKSAISKYLAYHREKARTGAAKKASSPVRPTGRQSVKELIGQNQGVSNIEVASSGIRDFERTARKYGVDYAVKKDRSGSIPKYLVFFKARDGDALTAAFNEYTQKAVKKKDKDRVSVLRLLRKLTAQAKDDPARVRHKELER